MFHDELKWIVNESDTEWQKGLMIESTYIEIPIE